MSEDLNEVVVDQPINDEKGEPLASKKQRKEKKKKKKQGHQSHQDGSNRGVTGFGSHRGSKAYIASPEVIEKANKLDIIERNMRIQEEYVAQNNGWNLFLEDFVKGVGEEAAGFRWMHGEAATAFNRKYQWFGLLAILLTTLAGSFNIPTINQCQSTMDFWKISSMILSFVTGVFLALQQFKNYGQRKSDHLKAESDFSALYNSIRQELSLNRRDRRFGKDYVEWITNDFDALKQGSPSIPGWILVKYSKMMNGKGIHIPNEILGINIKEESPTKGQPPETAILVNQTPVNAIPIEEFGNFGNFGNFVYGGSSGSGGGNVRIQEQYSPHSTDSAVQMQMQMQPQMQPQPQPQPQMQPQTFVQNVPDFPMYTKTQVAEELAKMRQSREPHRQQERQRPWEDIKDQQRWIDRQTYLRREQARRKIKSRRQQEIGRQRAKDIGQQKIDREKVEHLRELKMYREVKTKLCKAKFDEINEQVKKIRKEVTEIQGEIQSFRENGCTPPIGHQKRMLKQTLQQTLEQPTFTDKRQPVRVPMTKATIDAQSRNPNTSNLFGINILGASTEPMAKSANTARGGGNAGYADLQAAKNELRKLLSGGTPVPKKKEPITIFDIIDKNINLKVGSTDSKIKNLIKI